MVAVVALRPLIAETYSSAADPFARALQGLSDPSPVRTLVFDTVLLVAITGWLWARAIGQQRPYCWTGLEPGLLLIAAASAISSTFAGNQRLAINASLDWICMGVTAVALAQLLRTGWHRRLLLSAVVATAAVQAVQCFEQYATFDDTWAHYQSIKDEFWEAQGVDLDSGSVALFEQRIKSAEASGYFAHSNVAGAYLVLCGFAAAGVALQRFRSAPVPGIAAAAITAVVGVATGLTRSLGASLSAAAGVALWTMLAVSRRWMGRHRLAALWLGGSATAGAGLGVIGYGLVFDRLPGASLSFRWEYWKASAALISDHLWTGVGRENFGRHYLAYKPIHAPEEIANPHNLFVHAAAELGVFGALGLAMMLTGGAVGVWHAWRTASSDVPTSARTGRPAPAVPQSRTLLLYGAGILACILIARIPLLGVSDPNLVYYTTVVTGVVWGSAFALFAWQPSGVAGSGRGDNDAIVRTSVVVGLFTFLLHDLINFALFVPGGAITFFALAAVATSSRSGPQPQRSARGGPWRWTAPIGVSVATVVFVVVVVRPVATSNRSLRQARHAAATRPVESIEVHPALRLYSAAADADPLDPTPHVERARWLTSVAAIEPLRAEALPLAEESVIAAIQRDPYNCSIRRLRRGIARRKAEWSSDPADHAAAVRAAEAVLSLYPLSPADLRALAEVQAKTAETKPEAGRTVRAEAFRAAIATYRQALALDALRPDWEQHRRFGESELIEIRERIEAAEAALRPDTSDRSPGENRP